ncbi:uncharacterized protein LOC131619138 [Vicia villosa]|uniref:uncharacterized protein LOC131619138 n=1 Tax=Vicia villosa TaxID=3911 RepID=UPI00273C5D47|nr:uncharacterized protein LOC131619138 [Vicia villosa]
MNCTNVHKVHFGTHMLEKEVEDWWGKIVHRFDEEGIKITWDHFLDAFLENYFPEDVRGKKEVEFLELKHGNKAVTEYVAWFQKLIKYCPHYNTANAERSKCLKFVNGLRPEIKKDIGHQQILRFAELVNKSRIYDEDCRENVSHYKYLNDTKGKCQFIGKPYADKGKQEVGYDRKPSGGGAPTSIRCYKCGVEGHRASECTGDEVKCFKCGKLGHKANDCRGGASVTCNNYGEQWRISTKCEKTKKEQVKGKVFALSGSETTAEDRLI